MRPSEQQALLGQVRTETDDRQTPRPTEARVDRPERQSAEETYHPGTGPSQDEARAAHRPQGPALSHH